MLSAAKNLPRNEEKNCKGPAEARCGYAFPVHRDISLPPVHNHPIARATLILKSRLKAAGTLFEK